MVFKLPKPKRRINEKMTLEALHKSAETYMEMYEDIRKKKDILQKQLGRCRFAIESALNLLACPDRISETECNEQLAFNELMECWKELNNEK